MIHIRLDPSAAKSRLNQIRSGLAASRPTMLDQMGEKLVGLARIYFDNLSQGGSGYTGYQWRKPSAATVAKRTALARRGKLRAPVAAIGIVTGAMQRSLKYSVTGQTVALNYDDPAATWFNIHRRLIPRHLPTVWRQACEAIVQDQLDQVSKGAQ